MKNRKLVLAVLVIMVMMVSNSCVNQSENSEWSSMDPLSIPLELREKELAKGNLVPNNSFEEGRLTVNDTVYTDFDVKGWTKVGENVEWVNEANDGKHSFKIKYAKGRRETMEKGDGVISDYISVIPGNYLFYYDIRLERVTPAKWRLGTKINDAIDIRVEFYDKNKNPIDGKVLYPYYEEYLDNSFKGYAFSNFHIIEKFDWGKVRGRTYNYPFSEGDMPDNCRFVKIFLGFKGYGTMWVDNIEFEYSKWNFTTLERTKPYFEEKFSKAELLIPTPQKIENSKSIKYYYENIDFPVILIPRNADNVINNAATLLKNRLTKVFEENMGDEFKPEMLKIVDNLPSNRPNQFIISIGKTELYSKYEKSLPMSEIEGKQEAYIMKMINEEPSVLFLAGNETDGDYFAVATALQLFEDDRYVFCYADIIDYPDMAGRSIKMFSWKDEQQYNRNHYKIDASALLKFNRLYLLSRTTDNLKAAKLCEENGVVKMALILHPYQYFGYEPQEETMHDTLRYSFVHNNPKHIQELKDFLKPPLDKGAECVMILADDRMPHKGMNNKNFSLYTKEDEERFINLANAHAFLLNEIDDWIQKNYPGTRLEFCPPWYLNEFVDKSCGKAEAYFSDLVAQIPEDIGIVWTGNTIRSLSYDMADITRYTELLGREPTLWDNTLYARILSGIYGGYAAYYPGKVRMCNLMEPWDIYIPKDFSKHLDAHVYHAGPGVIPETYFLKYHTVADMEWNNNDYNADFSLWKAMLRLFGKETGISLLEFNDAYWGLVDMTMRIEREGVDSKYTVLADEYMVLMEAKLSEIKLVNENIILLVEELKSHQKGQIDKYTKLLKEKELAEKTGNRQL